jgi:hypothetical protein
VIPFSVNLAPDAAPSEDLEPMVKDTVSASRAIALHCSGSGARQWRQLGEGAGYDLAAPEEYGCKGTAGGTHAFTLADEAARIIHPRLLLRRRLPAPLPGACLTAIAGATSHWCPLSRPAGGEGGS